MAARLFILYHWKKQLQVFLRNLEWLKKQYNPDAIHDLRVAVKKLRAYLKLFHLLYPQKDLRPGFEMTEDLFSVLGKHRDIEMGILLLGELEKSNDVDYTLFREHLTKSLQMATEWMELAVANYDVREIKNLTLQLQQELKDADSAQLLLKVDAVIEKEYKKTKKYTDDLSRDTHQARKLYKDILYQAELCRKDALPDGRPVRSIKKILDHLGEWQDHQMLQNKVKHFRKDYVPGSKNEFGLLKDLEKMLENKKEDLLIRAGKVFEKL